MARQIRTNGIAVPQGRSAAGSEDQDAVEELRDERSKLAPASDARQVTAQVVHRAVAEIPAQTLDEGLVRNEVLLIAVPDEDGSPFGAATARELQRVESFRCLARPR